MIRDGEELRECEKNGGVGEDKQMGCEERTGALTNSSIIATRAGVPGGMGLVQHEGVDHCHDAGVASSPTLLVPNPAPMHGMARY